MFQTTLQLWADNRTLVCVLCLRRSKGTAGRVLFPVLHPLQVVLRQRVGVFVAAFVFPVLQDAVGDVV